MFDRRKFLSYIPAATFAFASVISGAEADAATQHSPSVGAIETLMRGHGILMRAVIIYDVVRERISKHQETEPALILKTTAVIHTYLHDFHEKMEESYIFKPMEKAHIEFASIQELKIQHGTGYELITRITNLAKSGKIGADLSGDLDSFTRMYRYHAAWEDTVVFPAFDAMERRSELAELAVTFESEEKTILGHAGFETFVNDIAGVEKQLGIYDPSRWTAKL